VVVTPRSPRDVRIEDPALEVFAAPALEICLNVGEAQGAELLSQVLLRFDAQLAELEPSAVAVIGEGPATLAGSMGGCSRPLERRNPD
jgi:UDP-N-acetylglucosamine 2-epimerase